MKRKNESGTVRARRESKATSRNSERPSHVGADGKARMVDVGAKEVTQRTAEAAGTVHVGTRAARAVRENAVAKGNVLEIARIAGIQAAKRTHELIPLCHPLPLDHVEVECRVVGREVRIRTTASCYARTGVEMEAMTALSVAALTVYDMLKSIDKSIEIGPLALVSKTGGKSGTFVRSKSRRADS